MPHNLLKTFFKSEIAIGILLLLATIAALIVTNSTASQAYQNFFATSLPLLSLRDWINDALMAIFFLLIGLELKKEILIGELSSKKKMVLPLIAACGGIIFPLLIFSFCNFSDAEKMRGFAIPTATDIAFAYGMISLFGKRIPNSLKIFLVALAVLDDLVAILFIAFFYSQNLDLTFLFFTALTLVFLAILNFRNSTKISLYLLGGIFLWLMILKSGIHPTLSGVLLALFIPLQVKNKPLLSKMAHQIAPAVNFFILPLFAFANAGIHIENFSTEIFLQPLVLGIAAGLFFGKQIGVMLLSFLAVKFKISYMPRGANWREFYAVAIFTGIGFTMSIFIAGLAFNEKSFFLEEAKIGILTGSLLSLIFGSVVIFLSKKNHEK